VTVAFSVNFYPTYITYVYYEATSHA